MGGYGVVGPDGEAGFEIGGGEFWAGSVFSTDSGAVQSTLTRYTRLDGAPGGASNAGIPPVGTKLSFDTAVAHQSLYGGYQAPLSNCQDLTLRFDDSYLRPASLDELAGVYTTSDENGYTLTVTIHEDGSLDGSDTPGCILIGNVQVVDPAKNFYRATVDASTCGSLDGHYEGFVTQLTSPSLLLAVWKPDAAIFDVLSR